MDDTVRVLRILEPDLHFCCLVKTRDLRIFVIVQCTILTVPRAPAVHGTASTTRCSLEQNHRKVTLLHACNSLALGRSCSHYLYYVLPQFIIVHGVHELRPGRLEQRAHLDTHLACIRLSSPCSPCQFKHHLDGAQEGTHVAFGLCFQFSGTIADSHICDNPEAASASFLVDVVPKPAPVCAMV